MSSVVYAIVFSGAILDGFETVAVKAHLARMLKVDQKKMAALLLLLHQITKPAEWLLPMVRLMAKT